MALTEIRKSFSRFREGIVLLLLVIAKENKCSKEDTLDKQLPFLCMYFSQR